MSSCRIKIILGTEKAVHIAQKDNEIIMFIMVILLNLQYSRNKFSLLYLNLYVYMGTRIRYLNIYLQHEG